MRIFVLAAAGALSLIVLSVYLNLYSGQHPVSGGLSVSLSSDNASYRSGEEMRLDVRIATGAGRNVTVRVYGIPGRGGSYRIISERNVSLHADESTVSFDFTMPGCYGCAGIPPGDYEITCEILDSNEVLARGNVTVTLAG